MTINASIISKVFKIVSFGGFIVALMLPCFDTQSAVGGEGDGLGLLISGFFGFFSSATGLRWLANPLLLMSWIFVAKKPMRALTASLAAFLIAWSFLSCKEIAANEGGMTTQITEIRIGYWVWFASIGAMLLSSLFAIIQKPDIKTLPA